jgi:hypothetical protein
VSSIFLIFLKIVAKKYFKLCNKSSFGFSSLGMYIAVAIDAYNQEIFKMSLVSKSLKYNPKATA